jgi:hypothetical protein
MEEKDFIIQELKDRNEGLINGNLALQSVIVNQESNIRTLWLVISKNAVSQILTFFTVIAWVISSALFRNSLPYSVNVAFRIICGCNVGFCAFGIVNSARLYRRAKKIINAKTTTYEISGKGPEVPSGSIRGYHPN